MTGSLPFPVPLLLEAEGWQDYHLLDSGDGRKLEQVGPYRFIRPEAQAIWPPALNAEIWEKADGEFISSAAGRDREDSDSGKWKLGANIPDTWIVQYEGLRFNAMPTPFRHLGFFPEQAAHWRWCEGMIKAHLARGRQPPKVLNLFGYTGVASLHAARAGAEVTHVDSSKKAISQAFANRDEAAMQDMPIRYITEDARRFVSREERRGRRYHGIILDPPKYGRGAKGEIWRTERDITSLLNDISAILEKDALFVVLTSYAIRSSFLSLHHAMDAAFSRHSGVVNSGELAVREMTNRQYRLSQAIFARWQSDDAAIHKD
jgi:23S rRNA (cytosine1962-C5)-methyltransferase